MNTAPPTVVPILATPFGVVPLPAAAVLNPVLYSLFTSSMRADDPRPGQDPLCYRSRDDLLDWPEEPVRTLAADTSSRSSVAYAQILFRRFLGTDPRVDAHAPELEAMLEEHDAALLIGDPALDALERRSDVERRVGQPLEWHDLAEEWHRRTGLPWVAAVWAVREQALAESGLTAAELVSDLQRSRDHGLEHVEELVREWTPRIAVPAATIRAYLSENIHYTLDADCLKAIRVFRECAAEIGVLPALPSLRILEV